MFIPNYKQLVYSKQTFICDSTSYIYKVKISCETLNIKKNIKMCLN